MEFGEKTRFQFEITPQNFHEFIPRVYDRLSLPASSLIFTNKEPLQEISNLEQLRSNCEKQQLRAIVDLRYGSSGDKSKYGISTESLRSKIEQNQVIKERYLVELIKAKGYKITYNEESRLVSIDFGNGKKLYGTVYSIIDAHPDLLKFEHILESFQTPSLPNVDHIMSFKTIEGDAYKATSAISGSYAQNEINPYPADYDFREFIVIDAESTEDGVEVLRNIILSNFHEFKKNPNIAITELKIGSYLHTLKDGSKKRIKLTWNEEEIKVGVKHFELEGEQITVLFKDVVTNLRSEDFVKFDFVTDISGIFRECSKHLDFKFRNSKSEEIFEHLSSPWSAMQVVFFEDPTNFGITNKTSDVGIVAEYYLNMLAEAKKLSDCVDSDSKGCNPVKAAKRSYNLLKSSGLIQQGREISSIFKSEYSKLYQISDYLNTALIVLKLLETQTSTEEIQKPITKENLLRSFQNLLIDIQGDEKIFKYSLPVILESTVSELEKDNSDMKLITERIQRLKDILQQEISSRVYQFLLRNSSFIDLRDQAEELLKNNI